MITSHHNSKVFWAPAGADIEGSEWEGGWGWWDEAGCLGCIEAYNTEAEAIKGMERYAFALSSDGRPSQEDVWQKIKELVDTNATHRKGRRVGDMSLDEIADSADDEMDEFVAAVDLEGPAAALKEAADVYISLLHFCYKANYTCVDLHREAMEKLNTRFLPAVSTAASMQAAKDRSEQRATKYCPSNQMKYATGEVPVVGDTVDDCGTLVVVVEIPETASEVLDHLWVTENGHTKHLAFANDCKLVTPASGHKQTPIITTNGLANFRSFIASALKALTSQSPK